MRKKPGSCGVPLLLALALLVSQPARSHSRLWLPMGEWELMPLLQQAAAQARASERCAEILKGGSSARYKQEHQAAFMVICRDAQSGSSYYLIYRQDSANTVRLVREQPRAADWKRSAGRSAATDGANSGNGPVTAVGSTPSSASAGNMNFVDADMGAVVTGVDSAWSACRQLLEQRVQRMLDVTVYDQPRPEAAEFQHGWRYRIDFDARNPRGNDLYFTAECEAGPEGVSLNLRGRPQERRLDDRMGQSGQGAGGSERGGGGSPVDSPVR